MSKYCVADCTTFSNYYLNLPLSFPLTIYVEIKVFQNLNSAVKVCVNLSKLEDHQENR